MRRVAQHRVHAALALEFGIGRDVGHYAAVCEHLVDNVLVVLAISALVGVVVLPVCGKSRECICFCLGIKSVSVGIGQVHFLAYWRGGKSPRHLL